MNTRRATVLARTVAIIIGMVVVIVGLISPAQGATKPTARNDNVVAMPGARLTVKVLANDTVRGKSKARVKVLSASPGARARVVKKNRMRVRVAAAQPPGVLRIKYKVTDRRGRSDTAAVLVTVTPQGGTTTPSSPAATGTLGALIDGLPGAPERRDGYERTRFKHWIDADRNGCDTRREVLIAEAIEPPLVGESCSLTGGAWSSYYDGATTIDPSKFDIDHMVPLAEAWDSGAWSWSDSEREAYANDLGDPRSLVAVSAASNRAKGDRDPAEWLPPDTTVRCRYVVEWVAVKARWSLAVDPTERITLIGLAEACGRDTPVGALPR